MKLNPITGKWETSFDYEACDDGIFVILGVVQKQYIQDFMINARTYYPKDMDRLSKILKDEKYTITDRKWMNTYFRSSVNKIVTIGSFPQSKEYIIQEPNRVKMTVSMSGMNEGDWYKVHYGDWENVGEEVPLIREFGKDYNNGKIN